MHAKDALGRYGEDLAAQYLEDLGLVILDRNWRCSAGELDVIARDGDSLVVCEVKTRRSERYGAPVEAVSPRKMRRLRILALRWLDRKTISYQDVCGKGVHQIPFAQVDGQDELALAFGQDAFVVARRQADAPLGVHGQFVVAAKHRLASPSQGWFQTENHHKRTLFPTYRANIGSAPWTVKTRTSRL